MPNIVIVFFTCREVPCLTIVSGRSCLRATSTPAQKNDKDWTVQKDCYQRGTHRRWQCLITKLRGGVRKTCRTSRLSLSEVIVTSRL
ncbi:hypothetical protein J6590_088125 [Homalodisca vitripennis]|nr:hypothetical protein J6590_088125 [Homalodisca vitripennis]